MDHPLKLSKRGFFIFSITWFENIFTSDWGSTATVGWGIPGRTFDRTPVHIRVQVLLLPYWGNCNSIFFANLDPVKIILTVVFTAVFCRFRWASTVLFKEKVFNAVLAEIYCKTRRRVHFKCFSPFVYIFTIMCLKSSNSSWRVSSQLNFRSCS